VIIFCDTLPFKNDIVPFRVAECGKYHPSTMPYLHEMEAMAWKIEARKRGPAGFGDAVTSTEMEIVVTPPRKDDGLGSIPR
jgi:hypothetical protein